MSASAPPWASDLEAALLTGEALPPAARWWADPARLLADASLVPDAWQAETLRSSAARVLLLCCRQAGKSSVAAALALREALLVPGSLVLLLSPTLRQSGELFRERLLSLYDALGRPVPAAARTTLTLSLTNGSRVVSLPETEKGVRGFSGVTLLVIDEAARVEDDFYRAVRPMLATTGGRLVALSTPFGQRGWFFDAWTEGGASWERHKATAYDCPRILRAFLEEERTAMDERWFSQEYLLDFVSSEGQVFDPAQVAAAVRPDVTPLFGR